MFDLSKLVEDVYSRRSWEGDRRNMVEDSQDDIL